MGKAKKKDKVFRWLYAVLDALAIVLALLSAALIGAYYGGGYAADNEKSLSALSARLSALFERIEYVCMSAAQTDWVSDFSLKDESDAEQTSVLEKLKCAAAVRSFNAMVGMGCEAALRFGRSGYVVNGEGVNAESFYFERFYDAEGDLIENFRTRFLQKSNIVGKVWYDFSGKVDESIVVSAENKYGAQNVDFVFVLSESFVSRELGADKAVSLLYGGACFYGDGTAFSVRGAGPDGIEILLDTSFPAAVMGVSVGVVWLAIGLLFVLARRLLTKRLSDFRFRLERVAKMLGASDAAPQSEALELMESTIGSFLEREEELEDTLGRNSADIERAYLQILLSEDTKVTANMLRVFRVLKTDAYAPRRVYCFESAPPCGLGTPCGEKILLVSCQKPVSTGAICGHSEEGTIAGGLFVLKKQALAACNYASLRGRADVSFSESGECAPLLLNAADFARDLKKYIVGRDERAGAAAVEELFSTLDAKNYAKEELIAFFGQVAKELSELTSVNFAQTDTFAAWKEALHAAVKTGVNGAALLIDGRYANYFAAIRSFIDENFTDPRLSLKMIAEHFYFSTSYVSRIFSENGEFRYLEYLNAKRIGYAQKLLRENYKLSEVASRCGFENTVTFRRIFKKETGVNPSDYKVNVSVFKPKDE